MFAQSALEKALHFLRQGGLVALPTETVYGLAGNALRVETIARIFEAKNRPFFDPLICHFASVERIRQLIPGLTADELRLLRHFSPGPLTLLVPKPDQIPALVTSGSPYVAVRVPNHPMALQVLAALDFPLAAPSANPFGYISPTTAAHVEGQLGGKVDYILDGGPCQVGVESTVVRLTANQGIIYRQGGIPQEALEALLPGLAWVPASSLEPSNPTAPGAPGQLSSHYAPAKKLWLSPTPSEVPAGLDPSDAVFIGFNERSTLPYKQQYLLSASGSLAEAAAALFGILHKADAGNFTEIVACLAPETGLGRAINDRLRRAAAKRG